MSRVTARAENVARAIKELIDRVNGKLDVYENLDCVIVDVADTGLANTTFTVNHNLGRKPIIYVANIDRSGIVYDQSRATWTTSQMTLKCSVANAVVKLLVF